MRTADFYAFARARHLIYLYRQAGRPEPWTDDPILGRFRFTNVFRELDRTTVWFGHHVRNSLATKNEQTQLLGTILFRTFNRTETAEVLFNQNRIFEGLSAGWSYLEDEMPVEQLEAYMRAHCPAPWVTGAYIVKTPDGMDKLRGALWIVEEARKRIPGTLLTLPPSTLQELHSALVAYPYLGGFTAYEIVSDVRHLPMMKNAPDIMTWAHAGPGAVRGLNRLHGRDVRRSLNQAQALAEMRELLSCSRDTDNWPQYVPGTTIVNFTPTRPEHHFPPLMPRGDWPSWEMREVEHTLCEWDKYERVRLGEGTPRGRFR